MPPSTAIETIVRQKAAKLELFSERIMGCRVLIEAPHWRRRGISKFNQPLGDDSIRAMSLG
jgi:hypothetical protein